MAASCLVSTSVCLASQGASANMQAKPVLNIVYIGDSITEASSLASPATQSAAAVCTAELERRLAKVPVYMLNEGHSGHTTVDFLPSTGTDFPRVVEHTRAMLASHGGRVVFSVMLGTNDSAQSGPNGAPVSASAYALNLRAMVQALLAVFPASVIVLERPTWYSPNTANGSEYGAQGLARLQTYFPALPALAAAFPGHVFLGDTRAYADMQAAYLTDLKPEQGKHGTFYLHPNADGAKVLGLRWADALLPVIERTGK